MKKVFLLFLVVTFVFNACQRKNSENTDGVENLTSVDAIIHSHGIAVDIEDPNKLYIASHGGLLLLKDETQLYKIGNNNDDLMGFAIDKKNPLTFYSSGHPDFGGSIGFQKTTDGGVTWKKVSDGIDGPVDFHSMTVSPVNSNIVYGSYNGRIQKSLDGGETWTLLENSPQNIFSLLAGLENESTVYATTKQGIWISKDGGLNWESLSKDLSASAVIALVQNPADFQSMLSVSDGLGLAESKDGGATWTSIANAPTTIFYYIAFSQSDPQLVYALDKNSTLYKSIDGGVSWEKIY